MTRLEQSTRSRSACQLGRGHYVVEHGVNAPGQWLLEFGAARLHRIATSDDSLCWLIQATDARWWLAEWHKGRMSVNLNTSYAGATGEEAEQNWITAGHTIL